MRSRSGPLIFPDTSGHGHICTRASDRQNIHRGTTNRADKRQNLPWQAESRSTSKRTVESSSGCRRILRTLRGIPEPPEKRTPLWARLTSPGRGEPEPPPIRPASEMVMWSAKRAASHQPAARLKHSRDAVDHRRLTASPKVSDGRMPAKRFASIVLPDPGGPIIRML